MYNHSELVFHTVLGRSDSRGKEEEEEPEPELTDNQSKPLDVNLLKTRAFVVNTRLDSAAWIYLSPPFIVSVQTVI